MTYHLTNQTYFAVLTANASMWDYEFDLTGPSLAHCADVGIDATVETVVIDGEAL